ncbi:MAG TPA: metal-dependent hydrolase [Chthoniobacterales bacterium]|nr:metal-dependent hydrolase [Chthoniobacterales bacterium]
MPTIFSHGVAAAALVTAFPQRAFPRRLLALGVVCAIAPDIDVIAIPFGARSGDLFGHRGFTHSLLFAAVVASVGLAVAARTWSSTIHRGAVWSYLFLAAASHGLLDALTDRNGLGIPFFWPFDATRYFFPFTPVAMSPLGTHFFSERGVLVLLSEIWWIWIPSLVFAVVAVCLRRVLTRRAVADDHSV